jgi:outer membrane protein assembly complex protein YaeT
MSSGFARGTSERDAPCSMMVESRRARIRHLACALETRGSGLRGLDGCVRALLALALLLVCGACALFGGKDDTRFLDLEFQGNKSISSGKLEKAIAPDFEGFDKSAWKKSIVDDAAYDLERYYNSKGFPFTNVRYEYTEPEGRKPHATFTITEGPYTELAEVVFKGNVALDADTLAKAFDAEGLSLTGRKRPPYVEGDVRASIVEIVRLYYERGYLHVTVSEPAVVFASDKKSARVTLEIREGIQHKLTSVELEGELVFSADELRTAYAEYIGKPYVERFSVEIQGRLEEYHAKRGRPDVTVKRIRRDLEPDGSVVLAYHVDAGPLVHVGDVLVKGNKITRTSFIEKRIELRPGDMYDREREHEAFRRLYRSGLFENVRLGLEPGTGEVRDLEVEVKEAPSLEVFVEPGYGSYERLRLSAGVREKNLFGTGRILQVEGVVGALAQNGKLSLIDPWILKDGMTADLSFFGGRRIEPSFTSEQLGGALTITHDLTRRLQLKGGYSYRYSASDNVDVVGPPATGTVDNVDISSFIFGFTDDGRDLIFAPTKGTLTKLSCEIAGRVIGSELAFVRVNGTEAAFTRLFGTSIVFAASLRTGVIVPIGDTTSIPIQERYFNGGENTVRSFLEDQLGPKDVDGNPIGGEAFNVLSFELRRPIVGHFDGALFWDLGNVATDHTDYFHFEDIRMGVGIGFRYQLPVGPLRLDGAINPNPRDDEARGAVHFSVGMAF